jgi:hypothetical protein
MATGRVPKNWAAWIRLMILPLFQWSRRHRMGRRDVVYPVTHKSVIKTTFLLYHAAVSAIAGG